MEKLKLILASTSQGRKRILNTLRLPFGIIDSQVNEDLISPKNPLSLVKDRAKAKGESVEKKINFPALIIAADSMVIVDGKAFGKAKTNDQAIEFLKTLSGKTHRFVTAVWIKNSVSGKTYEEICESKVTIRPISLSEIKLYASLDDLKKYAGAYSMTDSPENFITNLEGSTTNVVGLPLEILIPILLKEKMLHSK